MSSENRHDVKLSGPCSIDVHAADKVASKASLTSEERHKYTLMQAVGFNTMNMFGTGPLITIPYCINAVSPKGPQAMVGYALAVIACICDSCIWSELATMWPQSGGSYVYLRELYGPKTWGKLASFMFIWQFFVSGPAEVASGFIAIAEYMVYFNEAALMYWPRVGIALTSLLFCSFLLFRGLHDIGRITLVLWAITLFSIFYSLVWGFSAWDPKNLDLPENAFSGGKQAVWAVAAATRFGVYDMSGYYDVCFMGGEVRDPQRIIPISCIVTCIVVGIIFILVYLAVLGHIPWQFMVELYSDEHANPVGIMSIFAESRSGPVFAGIFTIIVALTIFGSVFAVLCGFGYLPYAAAKDGTFFSVFAHESTWFPGIADYSLGAVILLSGMWCFFSLELVVEIMTTMMVLVMFIGQSVGLLVYRYTVPEHEQRPGWRMPLFPLPVIIQLLIFVFIWITTDSTSLWGSETPILELSLGFIMVGPALFLMRAKVLEEWPFADPEGDGINSEPEKSMEKGIEDAEFLRQEPDDSCSEGSEQEAVQIQSGAALTQQIIQTSAVMEAPRTSSPEHTPEGVSLGVGLAEIELDFLDGDKPVQHGADTTSHGAQQAGLVSLQAVSPAGVPSLPEVLDTSRQARAEHGCACEHEAARDAIVDCKPIATVRIPLSATPAQSQQVQAAEVSVMGGPDTCGSVDIFDDSTATFTSLGRGHRDVLSKMSLTSVVSTSTPESGSPIREVSTPDETATSNEHDPFIAEVPPVNLDGGIDEDDHQKKLDGENEDAQDPVSVTTHVIVDDANVPRAAHDISGFGNKAGDICEDLHDDHEPSAETSRANLDGGVDGDGRQHKMAGENAGAQVLVAVTTRTAVTAACAVQDASSSDNEAAVIGEELHDNHEPLAERATPSHTVASAD